MPAIAIATVRLGQASQKRAVDNHRERLKERGLSRYEVHELAKDKALVRKLPAAWRWTMRRLRDLGIISPPRAPGHLVLPAM
jgi:hypothetical protein